MATHLLLALGRGGMGEVRPGAELARGPAARGERAVMVVHAAFADLFGGLGFEVVRAVPDLGAAEALWVTPQSPSPLSRQLLGLARELRPATVGLVDWVQAFESLLRHRVPPTLPARLAPVMWTLDTWSFAEFPPPADGAPLLLDISDAEWVRVHPGIRSFPRRLVPVPFARPDVAGGFRVLPDPIAPPADEVRALRRSLGVPDAARLLLTCTAGWQHRRYEGRNDRAARSVPALVALHLRRLPREVHVLHLGPEPFPALQAALGDRHHHLPPQPVAAFERALRAADALLSLNASATTTVSAAAADRPVVTLVNDDEGPAEGLDARLPGGVDPEVAAWAEAHLPLPAFRMWPLSMARALGPVLRDNPWTPLLGVAPILDARAVADALGRALLDDAARDALAEARARYVDQVRALPTGAERVLAYQEAG
jgi:hypothetical protein